MSNDREKVYINLNLQYEYRYMFSHASANFDLLQPILNHAGNYYLSVTDLQVDTRLIPLFIAELKDYQRYEILRPYPTALERDKSDSQIILNYWVEVTVSEKSYGKVYLKKNVVNLMKAVRKVTTGNNYIHDNSDKNLYIYSYQEFLDMVNVAITEALPDGYRTYGNCGFAIRNNKLVFLIQNKDLFNQMRTREYNQLKLNFSHSLFQYLGVGFPITYTYSHEAWRFLFPSVGEFDNQYYALIQNEPSLQSWNSCKAIVIYSNNLPIDDETFPTVQVTEDLTHYITNNYNIRHQYMTGEKKKVVYTHYVDYNRIKSLSNGICIHCDNIGNGIKINLGKALPVNKIDINIGWIDTYGNLFPLQLPYGGSCNIRLCFSRKLDSTFYDYTKVNNINDNIQVIQPEPIYFGEPQSTYLTTNWSPSMDPQYMLANNYLSEEPEVTSPNIIPIAELREGMPMNVEEEEESDALPNEIINENTLFVPEQPPLQLPPQGGIVQGIPLQPEIIEEQPTESYPTEEQLNDKINRLQQSFFH